MLATVRRDGIRQVDILEKSHRGEEAVDRQGSGVPKDKEVGDLMR